MANNVIGLFENEGVADQVVEELLASGFDQGIINRFKGNNDQLEDELRHEGIPADEASYYVNGLKEGGALVSVRAEESQTDTAVEIMNRFVAPAGGDDTDSVVADDAAPAAGGWGSSDVPARSGDTDRYAAGSTSPDTDYKGVDADSADYDGVGSSTGYGSASGYSDAPSDPAGDDSGENLGAAAAGGAGLVVGREAYDAYNRERAARGSAAPASSDWGSPDSGTGTGSTGTGSTTSGDNESVSISDFPIGREAYASYRSKPAAQPPSSADFDANAADAQASTGVSSSADGFPVGREAYASYQPKPAGPASPSSAAAVKAGRHAGAANAAKLEALVERLERVADRLEARDGGS